VTPTALAISGTPYPSKIDFQHSRNVAYERGDKPCQFT
jgi:hypothetical protein